MIETNDNVYDVKFNSKIIAKFAKGIELNRITFNTRNSCCGDIGGNMTTFPSRKHGDSNLGYDLGIQFLWNRKAGVIRQFLDDIIGSSSPPIIK